MSKIIAVNSGSSSLKFQLFEMPNEFVMCSGQAERIGLEDGIFTINVDGNQHTKEVRIPDMDAAVRLMMDALIEFNIVKDLNEIDAAGHRIVQGGPYFSDSVKVDESVITTVDSLIDIAPLHNKANLTCYYAFRNALPQIEHVFVFDTSFHQTMGPESFLYPVPFNWYSDYRIRKYGAHGTSHKYVAQRTAELMGKDISELNMITLHLGSGASVSAIKGGKVINTSMGLSPLGGIMMGTRCGDIDPTIVYIMQQKLNCTAEEMETYLNKRSGMLGVSGISSDARDIEQEFYKDNQRAITTMELYANRVVNVVGGYFCQLGHVDCITFTAGLGEHSTLTRKMILQRLEEALGLRIDYDLNSITHGEKRISYSDSKIQVFVVPTNEELAIVRDTQRILGLH